MSYPHYKHNTWTELAEGWGVGERPNESMKGKMDNSTTKVYVDELTGERHYDKRPRCKCEHAMMHSMTVDKVDVFQCDRCNRLFILNFTKQTMAWFIPEDSIMSTVAVMRGKPNDTEEQENAGSRG